MAPTNYLDQLILKSYPVPTLTVRRTNITADAPIQGKLAFRGKQWDTVERLGTPWVRKGTYIVEMRLKVDNNKNGDRKGLVFTEVPSNRPLMVHDAWKDNYKNLDGCIAPGKLGEDGGFKDSQQAMDEIMVALGGFIPGLKVRLRVENNVFGNETKDEWIQRRRRGG